MIMEIWPTDGRYLHDHDQLVLRFAGICGICGG